MLRQYYQFGLYCKCILDHICLFTETTPGCFGTVVRVMVVIRTPNMSTQTGCCYHCGAVPVVTGYYEAGRSQLKDKRHARFLSRVRDKGPDWVLLERPLVHNVSLNWAPRLHLFSASNHSGHECGIEHLTIRFEWTPYTGHFKVGSVLVKPAQVRESCCNVSGWSIIGCLAGSLSWLFLVCLSSCLVSTRSVNLIQLYMNHNELLCILPCKNGHVSQASHIVLEAA